MNFHSREATGTPSTEAENSRSRELDQLSPSQLAGIMCAADFDALQAVQSRLPAIATAIEQIATRMQAGGRLFYIGAGTSGRLGVLDASECPPTYNSPPEMVQALIAGGDQALRHAVEGAEDDPAAAAVELSSRRLGAADTLVGIAASGRTPYVLGAMEYARSVGAWRVGLSCAPGSPLEMAADLAITPNTGPEVVTGSTRLKAGTATKLVLNMLSTGVMVRLGYVYGNLMVNVQPTNAKLVERGCRIIARLTGLDLEESRRLLHSAGSVRVAIIMQRLGLTRAEAESRLGAAQGRLRLVIG